MSAVTTEKSKTAGAVVDEPVVPVQAGPVDEQAATAEAIAAALDPALVSRLAAQARARGVQLLGRGGVLQQLTKRLLEAALEAEMDEHLGYDKHDPVGRVGAQIFPRCWAQLIPRERSSMEVSTWMFGGLTSQIARGGWWV